MSLQITPARSLVTFGDFPIDWGGADVVINSVTMPSGNWSNIGSLDLTMVETIGNFVALNNCSVKNGLFPLWLNTHDTQIEINNCGLTVASTDPFNAVKGTLSILNEPNFTSPTPLYLTLGENDVLPAMLSLFNVGIVGTMTIAVAYAGCTVNIDLCNFITGITFDDFVGFSTQNFNVTNCAALASITLTLTTVAGYTFNFYGCNLGASVVDQLFIDINSFAGTETPGTIDVSGGTSAAPTATSLAARTALSGNGWTITTN